MGLRYQKRIGGSKGFGLNLSGSGVSSSFRSKYGAIGPKGFSIRTGIPGLSFRGGFGQGKNKGATILIILGILAAGFVLYYAAVILYNLGLFLWWALTEARKLVLRRYYLWQEKRVALQSNSTENHEE